MKDLNLLVTLWPSFQHFEEYAHDTRLSGIRLNSAMIEVQDLKKELKMINDLNKPVPLYFDLKGWQLRVDEVLSKPPGGDMILRLNHGISVNLPTTVLLKGGEDRAWLVELQDNGRVLHFAGGSEKRLLVREGESIHILDKSLQIFGPMITEKEHEKIALVREKGFKRYFLSYIQSQSDVEEWREALGNDVEFVLKIEDHKGLNFVAREFIKNDLTRLCAATGDLYVELTRPFTDFNEPQKIIPALKMIICKDPEAIAGSRLFLSNVVLEIPECCDFLQVGWLYDQGYRAMMLCDEICLKAYMLERAVSAFEAFREEYAHDRMAEIEEEKPLLSLPKGYFRRLFHI